jgi:SPP1 family predicted phage head-tail adaptor
MSAAFGAGSFRWRLELQEPAATADGAGGVSGEWLRKRDVWAHIMPVAAQGIDRAGARIAEITHLVHTRHAGDIAAGMRFMLGERPFQIETVCDPDETGRYLKCETREVPS